MKATVLVDNIDGCGLHGEWGLSFFIETETCRILLDTGASDLYLENAGQLGIDISSVDYGVLSHAHYDHANGMESFFNNNSKALFYIRQQAEENCYGKAWIFRKYIGMPRHISERYADRIKRVEGNFALCENAYLIPHYQEGLAEIGRKNKLFVKKGGRLEPDDFAHEQSLVFDTAEGLVIFNSCSHAGADKIIDEVAVQMKKPIKAMIGGFHLYNNSDEEVENLADRLASAGVSQIYTGHCTGKKAFDILKKRLGSNIKQLSVGLTMEF